VWWDACSVQLFQEVQSFAGFGYNGIDVGRHHHHHHHQFICSTTKQYKYSDKL